ncbi:AAA-ATPase [Desulfamplus magnetovallimortis]|uniref:AAA-ATPase n=1 Tax=Desulfamplus magnetovallimortis TaxID=1246637 RepID=L0R4Z2_9BACT|nr:ATP-binding protein [Desulfamplus magnetovallimortis]CCO06622.1 AAA-ATPase [Desulfamplus magnetovallimortis BW-1]SLM32673.1 AAA-ATPase [Desulfamplus magnetovallimortis]
MNKLPNLPTGDSSFESIRQNKYLYVDKTRHIYQLIDEGKYYFLSRPRRFGKSLTISTLKCLFQGKKELFKGLWITDEANVDWKWDSHPVIFIDFNEISHDTSENLKVSLKWHIENQALINEIQLTSSLLKDQFKNLIVSLHKKTGKPVVILIDEYDKPLIDHLGKGEGALNIAKTNREILKAFFGVLKGGEVAPLLRFVFITGVSKFSRVSIFSELNNLKDITMVEAYAEMLGYTQEELQTCFAPYITRFSEERGIPEADIANTLKLHYNGYRFSDKNSKVYNPFSVLNAMDHMNFKYYWFETGTPTFLVNLLQENNWYLPTLENMQATEALFSVYELERLQPEALLFQTGYVTIKDIRGRLYTFGYPNQEVKTAFLENLFYAHTRGIQEPSRFVMLSDYLEREDLDLFIDTMTAIYASIPYTLESKRDEAYFHTIFYLMVCASGVDAKSEVLTCVGRIDLVMEFEEKVFIIEFKCNQSADVAIEQIRVKNYADPYFHTGKNIILMGINFDTKKHNIAGWKYEKMTNTNKE